MGTPQENVKGYRDSSNLNIAAQLRGKLLIIQNLEDDNVLFQDAVQMVNALETNFKPYEFVLYPLKSHRFGGPEMRMDMTRRMTSFFDVHLSK